MKATKAQATRNIAFMRRVADAKLALGAANAAEFQAGVARDEARLAAGEWDDGFVPASDACPNCGEREMDALTWDSEGEYVTCWTCGEEYIP